MMGFMSGQGVFVGHYCKAILITASVLLFLLGQNGIAPLRSEHYCVGRLMEPIRWLTQRLMQPQSTNFYHSGMAIGLRIGDQLIIAKVDNPSQT